MKKITNFSTLLPSWMPKSKTYISNLWTLEWTWCPKGITTKKVKMFLNLTKLRSYIYGPLELIFVWWSKLRLRNLATFGERSWGESKWASKHIWFGLLYSDMCKAVNDKVFKNSERLIDGLLLLSHKIFYLMISHISNTFNWAHHFIISIFLFYVLDFFICNHFCINTRFPVSLELFSSLFGLSCSVDWPSKSRLVRNHSSRWAIFCFWVCNGELE